MFRKLLRNVLTLRSSALSLEEAERRLAHYGLLTALERRYATQEDLTLCLWRRARSALAYPLPTAQHVAGPITWSEFQREWLPKAAHIEVMVAPQERFVALTEAVHRNTLPLLRWDRSPRNTLGWYTHGAQSARWNWHLDGGYTSLTSITPLPCHWHRSARYMPPSYVLCLEGARPLAPAHVDVFPGMIRAEHRHLQKAFDACRKHHILQNCADASACGILFDGNTYLPVRVYTADTAYSLVLHGL